MNGEALVPYPLKVFFGAQNAKYLISITTQDSAAQALSKAISTISPSESINNFTIATEDGFAILASEPLSKLGISSVLISRTSSSTATTSSDITQRPIVKIEEKYYPRPEYSIQKITKILSQSLLSEFSEVERERRVQLAACYRLFEEFGWTDTIYGHLTVAATDDTDKKFLINPFGLLYSEITASSLVRVNLQGDIDHKGVTDFGINRAGYVIHSAIHEAREDIKCVMHCHFPEGVAVAISKEGLQRLSQTSQILSEVSYHEFEGIVVNEDEKKRLVKDLGPTNKILILTNHGLVTCGATISEAWFLMFTLIEACKIQQKALAMSSSKENLVYPTKETLAKTVQASRAITGQGFGERELSAYMRRLDAKDPSYRI